MEQAKEGDQVKVHYTGKFEDGTVFDSSEGRDPLTFTLGAGQMIAGFEQAVIGMKPGDKKTEKVTAPDAYGPKNDDLVIEVEKEQLPEGMDPEVGQQLQVRQQDGQVVPVVVAEVADESIKIDANHPLAGHDLLFDIELVDIG